MSIAVNKRSAQSSVPKATHLGVAGIESLMARKSTEKLPIQVIRLLINYFGKFTIMNHNSQNRTQK